MKTSEVDPGRVIREFFNIENYNWKDRRRDKPRVSRTKDREFYDWIWDNPAYEGFFEIVP